jgi:hypothetical protein
MATVRLPDDVTVHARSLGERPARDRPEFGVYLCGRRARRRIARGWMGTWRSVWLDWPPLRVPRDRDAAVAALVEAHRRAARGEAVEVACGSGRTRTGTALAALAICAGLDANAAADWARRTYPPARLMTRGQRRWLAAAAPALQAG